uniref:Uncharacterized protein LOC113787012 n=1 Tax=Cicer arietinum TaxID=3827 RepID=A0A3Q7XT64_CICAR|nr:uncharacterized protein LOC113787012 [Cicer arietinum]
MSKAKYIVEGGSSNRPPFFDGSDYYFWKNKMQLFLKSQDTGMWRIITDGDFTQRVDQDDSNSALRKEADWTAEDKAKVLLNSKAQLFLSCALSREESERVDECTTAKEVWDTLQTHHEGTSHVKETRIDIGIRKFELFEMQEGETIDEMYSRFTTIVNEMRSLGKAYTVQERVRKIMRCLPIIWRPMVTAISQAKNLESLPLEELIGTLRAHEIVLQEDKPVKKGKAIALKVSQEKITVPVEEESEENEQGDADEIALLTRRIQRMMRRRDQIKKGFQNRNPKTEIDKSQVTCFGCNKLGHYKAECPSNKNPPKRFPFKKKSMMATWDDSEESETEEEEEEANICLMAKTEEDEVMNSEPCHLCQQMGNEFDNLLNDSNLLIQKCSSLKEQFYKEKEEKERNQTENNLLKKMIQELKETRVFESEECQEHSALQTENVQLKNENELLKTDLLNFIKAIETFHNIMGSQIGIFDKAGLGFNQTQKTKLYENFFVGFQNTKRKPWFLDNGCSRHMTGDRNCFITFSKKDGGSVTFGNDDQAQIKGNGTIGKTNSAQINDVQYVEGLKHNLLSISQLCDNGCEVIFKPKVCEIKKAKTGKIMFSETFNSVIIGPRGKPTMTMFEDIKLYLMERWARNRTTLERYAGENIFEVSNITHIGDKFVVSLEKKESSCRKWMLTEIPCCHAVCCCNFIKQDPEELIPIYYRRETYAACYRPIIYPSNGQNQWPQTPYPDVLPPPSRRLPGRPKRSRNKDDNEKK